jgi:uncharacterized integral membrane protein (TIGR00697 family)
MKVLTKGKWLWSRTIGSTIVGQLLDSAIFVFIAFFGLLSNSLLIILFISNYIFKVSFEVILTPLTYKVISYLKKTEQEDYYDVNTNFNPLLIK